MCVTSGVKCFKSCVTNHEGALFSDYSGAYWRVTHSLMRDFGSDNCRYIQRKMRLLPKQGTESPWLNTQNYLADRKLLGNASFDDGALIFSNPAEDARSAA